MKGYHNKAATRNDVLHHSEEEHSVKTVSEMEMCWIEHFS